VTSIEELRSAGREELDLQERVDAAATLLTEMIDSLRRHPSDQLAPAAREALIDLRSPLEKALEALEDIERRRDLTDREEDLRHAFKMLLAAGR
jgi:hypothetical protein